MSGIGSLPQLIISMMLFLLLFFGIGFLLNMILRSTWIMAVVYPLVVIAIIDNVGFIDYILSPASSFSALGNDLISLKLVDILILSSGMVGAIIAGIAIRMLRVRGYQMF
ncbi:YuiB family protein [Alteribacillus sp. JSM 102045]|uniref:YuiB family protein n=1 Tax=Alteribacillus sp. JSM 102045 TaxID=1562101 RepID=UPI0035C21ADC